MIAGHRRAGSAAMWSRPRSSIWRHERDDGRTAEAFFFEPDPRCDNQLRADRWCSLLSFEPDFVRKIAREIASGKIDVSRRLEDYRAQRDRYRRELRLAVRSPAAGSWLK